MASIAYALERIKENPLEVLDRQMIERVCRECRHEWRHGTHEQAGRYAGFRGPA